MCMYWCRLCACVCVCVHVDPIVMMFVPGLKCGFLRVYNVMWELFEGTYLKTVVIVMYFVGHVILSLLINDFILLQLLYSTLC